MDRIRRLPLHPITCFMIVAVAAALIVFNVRGRGDAPWRTWNSGWDGVNDPQSADARQFDFQNAAWQHGWPLTYLERNCYTYYEVFKGERLYMRRSQWSCLPSAFETTRGNKDVFFSDALLWCDALVALAVLVAAGFVTERWVRSRRDAGATLRSRWLQFGLRALLLLPVIVALMFAIAHRDPSVWQSPGGILVWLLSAFLAYGMICSVRVVVLIIAGVGRFLRARWSSGQR